MRCDACGDDAVAFDVPEELREYAPDGTAVAAVCPTCLTVEPVADVADGDSDQPITAVHDAFPADPDAATGVALLLGLLESLVLNKTDIQALVDRLEAGGTDVFLVLDRLATDPDVDAAVDIERRRTQLRQMIE
jgi:hypothetical protein